MSQEAEKKIIIGQPTQPTQTTNEQFIPKEFIDDEFFTPTEEMELPSLGVFYPNGKKSVKVKYLTADEDDILFSPDLIKSGRVLDALLQVIVVDNDLNPDDMVVGDRNAILIKARIIGIGEEYYPGKMVCPSCTEQYEPKVNLSLLQFKKLEDMPDAKGEYDYKLPIMKKRIKFRLLNGRDENRINKLNQVTKKGGATNYKVAKTVTERYRLQIVEVEGNRDPFKISQMVSAMPMKDSIAFREYTKLISPGVDFAYDFECANCGHIYEDEVPMTYRLFYPNADL